MRFPVLLAIVNFLVPASSAVATGISETKEAPLRKFIVGYWAPDLEAMAEKERKTRKPDPNLDQVILALTKFYRTLTVEITPDDTILRGGPAIHTFAYTYRSAGPADSPNSIDLLFKEKGKEEEVGSAKKARQQLHLFFPAFPSGLVLNRIPKKDFEATVKKFEAMPKN